MYKGLGMRAVRIRERYKMKILLVIMTAYLLTGCGLYMKTDAKAECVNGIVVVHTYHEGMIGKGTDVIKESNRIDTKIFKDITCTKK